MAMRQRDGQPGSKRGEQPSLAFRVGRMFLNPTAVAKTRDERVVGRHLRPMVAAKLPCRGRAVTGPRRQRPQHPARAVDEFGECANDPDLQLFGLSWRRYQVDEFEPLDTIIVAVG